MIKSINNPRYYVALITAAALSTGCGARSSAAEIATPAEGIIFYGSIDLDLVYQTHGTPPDPYTPTGVLGMVQKADNQSRFSLTNNGMGNSKIGLKGSTAIGDDWSGVFKLESGINPASGNLTDGIRSIIDQNGKPLAAQTAGGDSSRAGQLFNQAAFAGVSNPTYGTLLVGRQTTLLADGIVNYDPGYASFNFSVIGYAGAPGGAGSTQDLRWDNSVKYLVSYGPFRAGAMYQFAGTIARDDWGVGGDVGVDYAGASFDAYYTKKKDEVAASPLSAAQVPIEPSNSFAATVSDNQAFAFMGRYTLRNLQFFGGYEHIAYYNPSSPLQPGTLDIGGYDMSVVNNTAYTNSKILQVSWGGLRYGVTPKFALETGYYRYDQNSYRGNGCFNSSAAQCRGQMNAVAVSADYQFNRSFEVYAGAMWSQVVGGLSSGYLHNNTVDPTIGARYIF